MSDDPPAEPQDASPATTNAGSPAAQVDKKAALAGALVGVLVGAALGAVVMMPIEAERSPFPGSRIKRIHDAGASAHAQEPSNPSFAQQGEDLVMLQMLIARGIRQPTYVDVGAWDPVINSNTYWFYKLGSDGVLVEPLPRMAQKLHAARPRDTVLDVGVGGADAEEADYWVFDGDDQSNTFSKKEADALVNLEHKKPPHAIKRRMVALNEILEQHFKKGSPHVISVDAGGLEYDILKAVDWKKWRPMIVCVDTAEPGTGQVDQRILELMEQNGYVVRGGSALNTIFLDKEAPPVVFSAPAPPAASSP